MKLECMYKNVLTYTIEDLMVKVEQDSEKRTAMLLQSMAKNDIDCIKKTASLPKLSDSEKAILKSLGLNTKSVKALKELQSQ